MICGCIPTETGNRRRQQSNVSDFKNLIEACATIVCETMGIRKSVNPQQEPFWKRRIESDITR